MALRYFLAGPAGSVWEYTGGALTFVLPLSEPLVSSMCNNGI